MPRILQKPTPPQIRTRPLRKAIHHRGSHFLRNGLSDPLQPSWGGRFQAAEQGLYRDAQDSVEKTTDGRATVWLWRSAFQSDFQARMDWTVTPNFADANHNPIAAYGGDEGERIIRVSAKPGQAVNLDASASRDPDGDELSFQWFYYSEPGNVRGTVKLENADTARATFIAPRVSESQTMHLILSVKDDGQPNLNAYRRVLIEITD